MTQRSSTYIFAGGLDEITQPLAVPKGRVIGCLNFESTATGYGRVQGYERFDGRPSPTAAYATAAEGGEVAAREAARALIGPVPGSGPVRGVAAFNGQMYAWRDNAGATACVMYRAGAGGWAAVDLGKAADFTSGSAEVPVGATIQGATSGKTAVVKRFVRTSGSYTTGDVTGYLVLSAVSGNFTPGEALKYGSNNDVANITANPATQTFPAGGRYITENTNFYGAPNMREMYGTNGVGRAFAFNGDSLVFIRTGNMDDRPNRVIAYKRHLFLGFPGGSVQNSGTGEPLKWNASDGAGEYAVGSEVTDFVAGIDALHIFTVDAINTLAGDDTNNFQLQPLNNEEGQGSTAFTAQTIGAPMYMDLGGFRSINSTSAYGNFRLGSVAPQVQPSISSRRRSGVVPLASLVTKSKDQYRLFYSDGTGFSLFFGRKYPEPMFFALPIVVNCACVRYSATLGETAFWGAADGYVYQADTGTSFDGQPVDAFLRVAWDNEGSSDVIKRYHKVTLELLSSPATQIGISAEFDYANDEQATMPQQWFNVVGGGGFWDLVNWDDFYWSAPAEGRADAFFDGQGENMSLLIVSSGTEDPGYTLRAIRKRFTVRGQLR